MQQPPVNLEKSIGNIKSTQEQALSEVQKLSGEATSLVGGFTNIMSNAQNILSQSANSITSNLKNTVEQFSKNVDVGLSSTMTDLTKKHGSKLSTLQGNTNKSSVKDSVSFITNTTDGKIDGMDIASNSIGNIGKLDSGVLNKLSSRTGMSITSDFGLSSAIGSSMGALASGVSAAKSISNQVMSLPSQIVGSVVGDVVGELSSFVNDTVGGISQLLPGIDVKSLISDIASLYMTGKNVYDAITGENCQPVNGLTSPYNSNFNDINALLRGASSICTNFNQYNGLSNFANQKNLYDILLLNMANQGMYGGIQQLVNCQNCGNYFDSRSNSLLSGTLPNLANRGDLYTFSTIQQLVGNNNIPNQEYLMYQLAVNGNYQTQQSRDDYNDLMRRMNMQSDDIFRYQQPRYNSSSSYYPQNVYNTNRVSTVQYNNSVLLSDLTGNRTTGTIAAALIERYL